MFGYVTMGKLGNMLMPFAPNAQTQPGRQCVNHRNAHTVQTAGNLVGVIIKLTAGVQLGHNNFSRRDAFFFVHPHRNTAAVVPDGGGTVGIQNDFGFVTITGQSLVNRFTKTS